MGEGQPQVLRVIVLGGGYAGVSFVRELMRRARGTVNVTLVDRHDFHTLLTETHTVAAGHRPGGVVTVPFATLLPGVRLHRAAIVRIDPAAKLVVTDEGDLPYDRLAFCLGGLDHDFGVRGVREHALVLRGTEDAERIRTRLQALPDGAGVVIVGGGLTGVELAAEMAMHGGRRQGITLVEAHPHLLHGLPAALQERARRRLGWLGVNVIVRGQVHEVAQAHVDLADGTCVRSALVVWAAGVKGHPLATDMGLDVDRAGRAVVDPFLRSSEPDVYVLGDSALWRPSPEAPALPPSAQLAGQMGTAAAKDLVSRLGGGGGHRFSPHLQGVLCDLGGLNATGLIYRFQVGGLLAALAKRASVWRHLRHVGGMRALMYHLRASGGAQRPVSSPAGQKRVE